MIFIYDKGANVNVAGTFYCGAVNATYDELVDCFGDPCKSDKSGDGKVNVEWDIIFEDLEDNLITATIYDWKQDEIPKDKHFWHVGGKGRDAVDAVYDFLDSYRVMKKNQDDLMDQATNELDQWSGDRGIHEPYNDDKDVSDSRKKFLEWKAKQNAC